MFQAQSEASAPSLHLSQMSAGALDEYFEFDKLPSASGDAAGVDQSAAPPAGNVVTGPQVLLHPEVSDGLKPCHLSCLCVMLSNTHIMFMIDTHYSFSLTLVHRDCLLNGFTSIKRLFWIAFFTAARAIPQGLCPDVKITGDWKTLCLSFQVTGYHLDG